MKFSKKPVHPFPKKDNLQIIQEEDTTLYSDDKERLIATEKQSRSVDAPLRRRIPQHEIQLMKEEPITNQSRTDRQVPAIESASGQEKGETPPVIILSTQEVLPKRCSDCPEHTKYSDGEIHWCPHCREWICARHYEGHIVKYHRKAD